MPIRVAPPKHAAPAGSFEALPRRTFMDSCTVQTMGKYGEFISDGGGIRETDRIHRIPDGIDNVEALRCICQVTHRAMFQWIVSDASRQEAAAKDDPDHLRWLFEIDHYSRTFLDETGPSAESRALAERLDESMFGYLGAGDRISSKTRPRSSSTLPSADRYSILTF